MLVLYHNEMSSSSQKVRLALAEKGLLFESRTVNLRTGEHQEDWYRALNPRAVVPTLVDGEDAIQESTVINEYLDDKFPASPLLPAGPLERARVRLWTKQVDDSIHDGCIAVLAFAIAFRDQLLADRDAAFRQLERIPDVLKRERRRDVLEHGLDSVHVRIALARMAQLLDEMQAELPPDGWLAGGFSLADVAIIPYLTRLADVGLGAMIEDRPKANAWFERCKARPSYGVAVSAWENNNVLAMMNDAGARQRAKIDGLLRAA